jgi:N-acetyl-D-muramate 6-phosphate phosphatase
VTRLDIGAVLFDLDGTLADTAPDLVGALNLLLAEQGMPAVPLERLRPYASAGARGLLHEGMGIAPVDARFETLRARFLDLYAGNLCVDTRLFPGMERVLFQLEQKPIFWGVVTNKPARFTIPLINALGLAHRTSCVVSGDTTPYSKPHPAPLLHAAETLGLPSHACLYVGDDLRDVQAARAAGMPVLAAAFGYLGDAGEPRDWGADAVIDHPGEIMTFLRTNHVG